LQLRTSGESENWEVIDTYPLDNLEEYPMWINQGDIAVLLLDERLQESRGTQQHHITYGGHDVVSIVRSRHPTLPIFIVTENQEDDGVIEKFKDVEDVIGRTAFYRKAVEYVTRFIRSGLKFYEIHKEELAILDGFSQKMAKGESISADEQQQAKAIRLKLSIAYDVESLSSRGQWIGRFEAEVDSLKSITTEIEKIVSKKKKK